AFTECVQEAGAKRLQARSKLDALELERRTRHVAHAREHALKDLS
ncbi:jg25816, partial [Pararge aegeria aegeria]